MRKAVFGLFSLLLCACSPTPHSSQLPPSDRHAQASVPVEQIAYCDDPAPVQPCTTGCANGTTCVDGWCQAVWAADCAARCRPRIVPDGVLCHGNLLYHAVFKTPLAAAPERLYLSVRVPAAISPCGDAWVIYEAVRDDTPRPLLDLQSQRHWWSPSDRCLEDDATATGYEPLNLLQTAGASWTVYMMPALSGNAGFVVPNG